MCGNPAAKIQPLLLFLLGVGFVVFGFRFYPAFVGVGGLFLIIGYRGFTCLQRGKQKDLSSETDNTFTNG